MTEAAKQQAIQDIKEDLEKNHKCFIAFFTELDEVMEELVNEQNEQQQKISKV